ncbi:hypothetical protein [Butyrivibrio sp. INlla16]|uniref:hypothetical protein n=1 Tax=Butyrivibrio sp. INlla16 TaxID=1520807 RepID=UPI00088103DD|nr:hypothetical protein [Butyrivibrio sp. INlla16]SDB69531.1 hypothetical protein SAMN02910263_04464 [Butyrivibrio sp. INlla16]
MEVVEKRAHKPWETCPTCKRAYDRSDSEGYIVEKECPHCHTHFVVMVVDGKLTSFVSRRKRETYTVPGNIGKRVTVK